jgi:hypothetical protein
MDRYQISFARPIDVKEISYSIILRMVAVAHTDASTKANLDRVGSGSKSCLAPG